MSQLIFSPSWAPILSSDLFVPIRVIASENSVASSEAPQRRDLRYAPTGERYQNPRNLRVSQSEIRVQKKLIADSLMRRDGRKETKNDFGY